MPIVYVCDDDERFSTEEVFGCDDAELDAIVSRVRAKMAIVAARYGTDEEGLADAMMLMADDRREEVHAEIRSARVDPRTGSGLS